MNSGCAALIDVKTDPGAVHEKVRSSAINGRLAQTILTANAPSYTDDENVL